jgi:hypothetical protein
MREARGQYTSWGGQYKTLIFLCWKCIRNRERAENAGVEDKIKEIADWAKTRRESKPEAPQRVTPEENSLREILERICTRDDWYKIDDITQELRKKPQAGFYREPTGRFITILLKRLGFLERRRGAHGYMYVYIVKDQITSTRKA